VARYLEAGTSRITVLLRGGIHFTAPKHREAVPLPHPLWRRRPLTPSSSGGAPQGQSNGYPLPAQLIALAALDTDTVWLFTLEEARSLAQQHSDRGIRQLYWRREPSLPGAAAPRHEGQMHTYLLATRAPQMFPA
jgi:hypothetical protein